jgi:formiminotetrahydrofolate cyclodeaminase
MRVHALVTRQDAQIFPACWNVLVEGTDQEIGSFELRALLDIAARPEPGVGAGSMAAVCVAVAASLVAKSARASRDVWPEARAVAAQAGVLATRALRLAELDAEAFQAAIGVLRPSDDDAPEDEGRDDLIAAALTSAAYLPLRIASVAADVAILGATAREGGSAGDLEPEAVVGALLAEAAARSAAYLVEVNLTVGTDDERAIAAREQAHAATRAARQALAGEA